MCKFALNILCSNYREILNSILSFSHHFYENYSLELRLFFDVSFLRNYTSVELCSWLPYYLKISVMNRPSCNLIDRYMIHVVVELGYCSLRDFWTPGRCFPVEVDFWQRRIWPNTRQPVIVAWRMVNHGAGQCSEQTKINNFLESWNVKV